MQFISNGPDIPDELLQAHEEGRVVFFCGAGVSYPAGLPGFKGLVEDIYRLCGTDFTENEKEAFERGQYDATLDLLERRLPGQRVAVRRKLAEALVPSTDRADAIETQIALLRLGRSHEGALRLVTTNFDRTFHAAAEVTGQSFENYAAPMLPIPKNSRWDGLVFLHGLLSESADETSLNRLVVTSGDFGLAYLTERWAARFVSELFRNYEVCFVGYSINDPVLRYMRDALAADRMLGEITPKAWAFADYNEGQEGRKLIEWEAKGVTPILYMAKDDGRDHSLLHKTLKAWSETYRDGTQGKEAIIVKYALALPQNSSQQDNYVGRMIWALSDKSGLPAKRFANFNPAPSLDWLFKCLDRPRFSHQDLVRLGVRSNIEGEEECFSLVSRPAPYDRTPLMQMVSNGANETGFDNVMHHLACWLVRYLDDPDIIVWIRNRGGHIHSRFKILIENQIDKIHELQAQGSESELDAIRDDSPKGIPRPFMRVIWRILLSGKIRSPMYRSDLFRWKSRFSRDGMTKSLRLELRELLAPKIDFKKPFRWKTDLIEDDDAESVKDLVDWELVLDCNHVHSALEGFKSEEWDSSLPDLLPDFEMLVRDALDLQSELGGASEHHDLSFWHLPSISPHWQNRHFKDWVSLIELLRDSWLAILNKDINKAKSVALSWFDIPYPTFKRMALFAASHDGCVDAKTWTEWLISDRARWMWSNETGREVCRLLVLQGKELDEISQNLLEVAILEGPPREMYSQDISEDHFNEIANRSTWLHLKKLQSSGASLGCNAEHRLSEIEQAYPGWRLTDSEREEFSHWMSGTGDPDYEATSDVDLAPRTRAELSQWLSKSPSDKHPMRDDTWQEVCRSRFYHSVCALNDLARKNNWPKERWREAFQVWSEESMLTRSWRCVPNLVENFPDEVLQDIAFSVAWWLKEVSGGIEKGESSFIRLCFKIINLPLEAGTGMLRNGQPINDPVMEAINHPVGIVAEALMRLSFRDSPKDNDLIPSEIKDILTVLCDPGVGRFRHARNVMASRLVALYRIDKEWVNDNLIKYFDWGNEEASLMWEGFLRSPRLFEPLMVEIKKDLLDCSQHYSDLGEHRNTYAAFLTYAALNSIEGFSATDFRAALNSLPQEGLQASAQAFLQALDGSADQREEFWENRVLPFWNDVWPKNLSLVTPKISESLSRLAISAREKFPEALDVVADWLCPFENADFIVHLLLESPLCERFPESSLRLLASIVDRPGWALNKLGECLDRIVRSWPEAAGNPDYRRLLEYSRQN